MPPTTATDFSKLSGVGAPQLSSPASPLDSFSNPPHSTGHKKALLIGVRVCQSAGYGDLDVAHDDVRKMRDLLIEVYHYEESEITILLDDGLHTQPTRENILAAIGEFVKNVKAGDKLCFHYSGHSTQVKNPNSRSCSEEDGLDECLVPFDGENMKIVDNELHAALVQPLPSGSHLVAVLDTCNSGSLLDLKHYRCNRVSVPWKWRGRRDSEPIRNNVVRRGARLVTLSQTTGPAPPATTTTQNAFASQARRRSVISVMCDPPTPSPSTISPLAPRASTGIPTDPSPSVTRTGTAIPRSSPLTRLRAGSKLPLARLRTLSVSLQSPAPTSPCSNKAMKNKENFTTGDVGHVMPTLSGFNWIFHGEGDEEKHCESPVGRFPCSGWCRNVEGRSTLLEEDDEVKADVISLASCKDSQKAWEGDGVSVTSVLVELLRENPERSLQDILIQISHKTYSLALSRHSRSKKYKAQRKDYIRTLMHQIKRLERGNRSTASLVTPDIPGIAVRPTFPHATSRGPGPKKPALLRTVGEQIQTLKEQLLGVRQDKGYDMDAFQNPELSSPRPLDMSRPWRM
ncbi:Metacaspase type II [Favolaschia claudopus]|uniref:Metacaspase type II n=1 Tax=Favolaschia claudopus TaxID=2862362 RepID=A0AAW0A6D2_9AGAR